MSRIFRLGATLTCLMILLAAPAARAQRGHGGHVAVAHVHGGHPAFVHGGNFGHGHGNVFALSVGLGFGGYGGFGYGGLGYPGYYSAFPAYYADVPAVYSGYPAYSLGSSPPLISTPGTVVTSPPAVSAESTPAPPAPAESPPALPNAASIDVRLPDPNAQILVDGQPTKARGRSRTLVSPELTPGKVYVYKLTATWNQDGQRMSDERTVEVTAGKTTVVDFTQGAGAGDALPFPKERNPGK